MATVEVKSVGSQGDLKAATGPAIPQWQSPDSRMTVRADRDNSVIRVELAGVGAHESQWMESYH